MRTARFLVVLIAAALTLFAAGAHANDPIGSVMAEKCSRCHTTSRICRNLGEKNRMEWESTISRMLQKGAQLPPARKGEAAQYLALLQPGTGEVCR